MKAVVWNTGFVIRVLQSPAEYIAVITKYCNPTDFVRQFIVTSRGTRWGEIISVSDLYEI